MYTCAVSVLLTNDYGMGCSRDKVSITIGHDTGVTGAARDFTNGIVKFNRHCLIYVPLDRSLGRHGR